MARFERRMMWRLGLAGIAALFGGIGLQGCGSSKPNPEQTISYIPPRSTAITKVQFDAHLLKGFVLTPNEPGIVSKGPPVRAMCGVFKGSHVGVITFDAMCDDASDKACADIVSVDLDQTRISGPIA